MIHDDTALATRSGSGHVASGHEELQGVGDLSAVQRDFLESLRIHRTRAHYLRLCFFLHRSRCIV